MDECLRDTIYIWINVIFKYVAGCFSQYDVIIALGSSADGLKKKLSLFSKCKTGCVTKNLTFKTDRSTEFKSALKFRVDIKHLL